MHGTITFREETFMKSIILPHGKYQDLESYKNSVIIYAATQYFCQHYLSRGDRTIDQMTQAARSGKQNIVEGCMASGASTETEIKLISVARASLEELLEDYKDYLRTHNLLLWNKDDIRTIQVRQMARLKDRNYEVYRPIIESNSPEYVCNAMITLIHQTNFLLDHLLDCLQRSLCAKGSIRERIFQTKKQYGEKKPRLSFDQELERLRTIYQKLNSDNTINAELKTDVLSLVKEVAMLLKEKNQ